MPLWHYVTGEKHASTWGCLWMDAPQAFIPMNGSTTLSSIQFIPLQHSPSCDLLLEASGFHPFNCSDSKVCKLLKKKKKQHRCGELHFCSLQSFAVPPWPLSCDLTDSYDHSHMRWYVRRRSHAFYSFPLISCWRISDLKSEKNTQLSQMCCWAHGAFLVLIRRWQAVNQWEMFLSETICWCSANPVWVCSGCWLSPEAARSWEKSAWNSCHKVHSFFLGDSNPLELCDFGL